MKPKIKAVYIEFTDGKIVRITEQQYVTLLEAIQVVPV